MSDQRSSKPPLPALYWYHEFLAWAAHPAENGYVPVHPDTLRTVATILLEHHRCSVPPNVWQPIETAPKLGKWVLLWWPAITDAAFVGYCVDGVWKAATSGDKWPGLDGPTHWMPLPAGPAVTKEPVPSNGCGCEGACAKRMGHEVQGECAADEHERSVETSARPTIREFIQEARASCLHGGDQHCPCFKKGHPCCDCGATVSENAHP